MKNVLSSMKSSKVLKGSCIVLGIIFLTSMNTSMYVCDAIFSLMFIYYTIKWFKLEP